MDKQLTQVLITLFILGAMVLVIVVGIASMIMANRREKERTLQLQNSANYLGMQFAPTAPMDWMPNLDKFALFSEGHSKSIKNVMYGQVGGVKAALFDYRYVVGGGKHRTVYNQSVVYFEPANLSLPFFSLRPENYLHKLISAFGYQDIDFGNRPEFSREYLLRGPDEQAIHRVFSDATLSFYEANVGTCTDGGGNQLFIFRQGHRVAPQEAQSFINSAVGIKNLFGGGW